MTTLDVISGGRAILGLGAAWNEDEHAGYGVDFPPIGERMDRLDEALDDRQGDVHRGPAELHRAATTGSSEALNVPKPIQPGGPTILVGGGGEQRTLKIAAQHADMTHWFPLGFEVLRHKTEVLAAPLRGDRARPGDDRADDGRRRSCSPRTRPTGERLLAMLPPERRAHVTARDARAGGRGLRPYLDAGFTGFTFNNTVLPDARVDRPRRRAPAPRELMRPFRFLAEAGTIADGKALAADARRAEAMGIDVLVIPDHLIEQLAPDPVHGDGRGGHGAAPDRHVRPQQRPAPPGRPRPGPGQPRRPVRRPARDRHRGRLERAGVPGDRASRSSRSACGVSRLAEAIAVLKGAFAPGPFSFTGRALHDRRLRRAAEARPAAPPADLHRRRRAADPDAGRTRGRHRGSRPAGPARRSRRSDPRSLTIAAAEEKIGWVREAAGDRFDRLEFNIYPSTSEIIVTDRRAGRRRATLAARLRARTGIEIGERELLESPHIFIGSIDGLVDKFRMLRERLGISSIMVGGIDELAPGRGAPQGDLKVPPGRQA